MLGKDGRRKSGGGVAKADVRIISQEDEAAAYGGS